MNTSLEHAAMYAQWADQHRRIFTNKDGTPIYTGEAHERMMEMKRKNIRDWQNAAYKWAQYAIREHA